VFSVDHSSDNTSNVKFKKDIRRIIAQCIPATMRNSTIMILRKKSFHLHLQHPKQHLSMPKLCSKPKQLRERLEKDRAGRSTISFKRSRLSSERTTAICKRNLGNQGDWPYRPRPQGGLTYVAPILSAGCLKALVLSKKRGIKKRKRREQLQPKVRKFLRRELWAVGFSTGATHCQVSPPAELVAQRRPNYYRIPQTSPTFLLHSLRQVTK
jgi:hypothetical protein